MMHLVGIILTYNESEHISACIESLAFADLVVVIDSFSTDNTVALAEKMGAVVYQQVFQDYANQRNFALECVKDKADWVLFVDADERVTPELARQVTDVINNSNEDYAGWEIPRHNYIFDKLTRGAGWYPDYQTRLLRVGSAQYDPERKVHEVVILKGQLGTMSAHLTHYNYKSLAQFFNKQQKYTAYEAQIMYQHKITPKFRNYILQPLRQFYWRFFTLRGYGDGWHGLRLSILMSWYEFRKYMILRELWKEKVG